MSGLRRRLLGLTLSGAVIALAGGCDDDARVAATAERAAERQAAQNEEVVRLNREVAEGTRRLVEADAQAREELAAAQRELHKERAEINTHRDALEEERKQMARQRQTVSLWAPVVTGLASLVAVAVLGAFCWSLLFGLRHEDDPHEALSELLVSELLIEEPTTPRPTRPAIQHERAEGDRSATLPSPDEPITQKETNP